MSGLYDVHCHIVPHVDDGASSMEESMNLLRMEYEDGVRTIYVTPHYRRGMFETPMEKIYEQFARVKEAAPQIGPDLRIFLGCEFHANMDMVDILDAGGRPTMGESRCVLTEFSEVSDQKFIQERCYALLSHGYQPIIAHIERYPAMRDIKFVEQMVNMGAYIQMNSESIIGMEGFGTKMFCKKVIKKNLLHFIGSDAHNTHTRKPEFLTKAMGADYMRKIMVRNPRRIIEEDR